MLGLPHVGQYLGSSGLSSTHLFPHFKQIHSGKLFHLKLSLKELLSNLNLFSGQQTNILDRASTTFSLAKKRWKQL